MAIQISPPLVMSATSRLLHGAIVIDAQNRLGMAWRFPPVGTLATAMASKTPQETRFLDLVSLQSSRLQDVAVSRCYMVAIGGQRKIKWNAASLTYDATHATPGDLVVSGVEASLDKLFIVLLDPVEGKSYAYSFDDPDTVAYLSPGYIGLIKEWSLEIVEGDDVTPLYRRSLDGSTSTFGSATLR